MQLVYQWIDKYRSINGTDLLDDLEVARKKIMSSVTDSESIIKYDVENKPGISNLMTIYSCLTNKNFNDIETEFIGQNYGTFKKVVADQVINLLKSLQEKYNDIIKDDYIDKVLDEGLKVAEKIAKEKTLEVYQKLGLGRY